MLTTLPADDFPNIETQEQHLSFQVPQQELLYLLKHTHFAIAQQDVRHFLNGMLFEVSAGTLRVVATDGHRLATTIINANTQTEHRLQIIVPRKGILELMRLLDDVEDIADVTISSNHICVATSDCTFTSKLIEGRYPDYERVIPKPGDKFITMERDQLKQALNRVAVMCNEQYLGVRFELKPGLLHIYTNNPEQETAEEELSVDYKEEALDISFNVTYLLDVLNIVKPGEVKLYFAGSNNSILIHDENDKGDSTYIVMPMQI